MRGSPLHNDVLIGGLRKECIRLGCSVATEVKVSDTNRVAYVDMLIEHGGYRIGVEAELSVKRIENDLWKAAAAMVDELWFLVPNKTIERGIQRKLKKLWQPKDTQIFVLTLGLAKQKLENRFSFISSPNTENK